MKLNSVYLRDDTKTIFSTDPELFSKEIKNHPWYEYVLKNRELHGSGRTVPGYHYTAPEGYFNDATGFCKWNGKWHLFYGERPFRTEGGGFLWGHIVSDDLIHWMDLPPAIVNGPEPETWTGSVLAEDDRCIAAYRIYGGGELGIGIAVSSDPLLVNWEKLKGEQGDYIVIHADPSKPEGNTGDPFIWKKGDYYYIISGKTEQHPGSNEIMRQGYLYRSTDLEHWEYLHPFLKDDCIKLICDDLSCPTFWPLEERYLLTHYSHTHSGRYIIGDYNKEDDTFRPVASESLGNGCFPFGGVGPTASTLADGDLVMLYEINGSPDNAKTWYPQVFSLPRKIGLSGIYRDELTITPYGNYASLRGEEHRYNDIALTRNKEYIIPNFQSHSFEAEMTFSFENKPMIELRVLRSPDASEYTSICFYSHRGVTYRQDESFGIWDKSRKSVITINTDNASLDDGIITRAPERAELFLHPDEKLHLHIFADVNVLEVFVNDKVVLATRAVPSLDESAGMSVILHGTGSAKLEEAIIWKINSISPQIYQEKDTK